MAADDGLQDVFQFLVRGMLHHKGCQLAVQVTEDDHVAVARLIEHGYHAALSEGGPFTGFDGGHIGNVAIITDGIVVDIVAYFFNEAVVAHLHIAQGGVVDACMLVKAAAHLHLLLESTDADVPVQHHPVHEVGKESVGHLHLCPVLRPAVVGLEHADFVRRELSEVFHHSMG